MMNGRQLSFIHRSSFRIHHFPSVSFRVVAQPLVEFLLRGLAAEFAAQALAHVVPLAAGGVFERVAVAGARGLVGGVEVDASGAGG